MLGEANMLRRDANNILDRLAGVRGEVQRLKRQRSDDPAFAGKVASARGNLVRAERDLDELDRLLQQFSNDSNENLNEPGRYGDAALVSGPGLELLSLLQSIAELFLKAKVR